MNKYSKFSTNPITPSTKTVTSVPYADAKPAVATKKDETKTAAVDEPKK